MADAEFDKNLRLITLYVIIFVGLLGCALVLIWLYQNRRRKSRVNVLILNVTISDLLVICFACLMQVVWEHFEREWLAGIFMCKFLKWMQGFVLMASNNLVVVLSIDRHQAIRAPLKQPFSVSTVTLSGYKHEYSVPETCCHYTYNLSMTSMGEHNDALSSGALLPLK